jgi:ferrous iron transport protein A
MRTLRELPIKKSARILRVHGEGALKRRLMDMGLTRGTVVTVKKVAPLGDPIEVTVRGYELSLRKDDAALIEIEQ